MSRGEYGRPRAHHAGHHFVHLPAVGFSLPPGILPNLADVRQQLAQGAAQLHQAVEQQVEHTVKVRGAVLIVGAVATIGLIAALSAMADP